MIYLQQTFVNDKGLCIHSLISTQPEKQEDDTVAIIVKYLAMGQVNVALQGLPGPVPVSFQFQVPGSTIEEAYTSRWPAILSPMPIICKRWISTSSADGHYCRGRVRKRDGFYKCARCGTSYGPIQQREKRRRFTIEQGMIWKTKPHPDTTDRSPKWNKPQTVAVKAFFLERPHETIYQKKLVLLFRCH